MWIVVQCSRKECAKFMVSSQGIQRKKCPYCGRTFKAVPFNEIVFESQEKAREYVQKMNYRYGK